MKYVLRPLAVLLWVVFAACLPQAGPTGEPAGGGLMGAAADVRPAGGGVTDPGGGNADDSGAAVTPPDGKFADASSDTSGSPGPMSSMMFHEGPTAMPAGSGAPIHDPEDAWRYALKGTSEVSCALKDSNRVMLEIRGSIQFTTTHYERGPSGDYRLTIAPQSIPIDSGDKPEVLRTVFKNNDQLLFMDQVPASSAPNGLSMQGIDLALVDFGVATTDPASVYFLVVSKDSSPLFAEKPHATGTCETFDCARHFGRFSNEVLTQWLTVLASPDPLPDCPLPSTSLFMSPMTSPAKATP